MSDNQIKREPGEYDYDSLNDTFYTYLSGRKYNSSLIFDEIILDLDENDDFVGFEILNASKKFGINKYEMGTPIEFKFDIDIVDDELKAEFKFTFMKRNHPVVKTISATGANDMNLSPASHTLALA